jgi:capsid protein
MTPQIVTADSFQHRTGELIHVAPSPVNMYEAVQDSPRRRRPNARLRDEDRMLQPDARNKMVGTARDLRRNFTDAAFAIRLHLDFLTTLTFQARTLDKAFNKLIEQFVAEISKPHNFDAAGRHSRQRFTRLLEAGAVIDGDCGCLFNKDGHVQGIEGDRIRSHQSIVAADRTIVHGVEVNDAGRALRYIVCRRQTNGDGFDFERSVNARYMHMHGYFDRFDQVRGVTPLSTAINQFVDSHEGRIYALARSKIAQLFGLVVNRKGSDPFMSDLRKLTQGGNTVEGEGGQDYVGQVSEAWSIGGVPLLDMGREDDVKFLENRTPALEWQKFDQIIIASAYKSLDIPFSFYDEAHTNFFGTKSALQRYLYSVDIKRDNLIAWLDRWVMWRLGMAVARGELVLPRDKTFDDIDWEWVPQGLPWWKPLEEVKAQDLSVRSGFTSVQRVCKERGEDALEILDEKKHYAIAEAEAKQEVIAAGGRWPGDDAPADNTPTITESALVAEGSK